MKRSPVKLREPTRRSGAYELYWKFASERHQAFEARIEGKPQPWTDNAILQTFKFCNVFRAADRVSQYMIRNVVYLDDDSTVYDRIFQIVAFRTFSKISAWDDVIQQLGRSPRIHDLIDGTFENALTSIKESGAKLYTGAFILCATDYYGRQKKHLNHVELFKQMFAKDFLAERILESQSLEGMYGILHLFPLMGDFMSYQIAIDLNYSELFKFSENDFTQPGPGAMRGIRKVFSDLGDFTPRDCIMWMVDNQNREFERLGLEFNGLWGRPIHAIDAQSLFCETDKYCREAIPELRSARKRIKATFKPSDEKLDVFFPPKWDLSINSCFKTIH
jgi:hypothetical protein